MTADPVEQEYFISKNRKASVLLGLKLAALGTSATFTDILRAEHIAAQWVSGNGETAIHFINSGILKYWSNIILYRGNIFTERINTLLIRIK